MNQRGDIDVQPCCYILRAERITFPTTLWSVWVWNFGSHNNRQSKRLYYFFFKISAASDFGTTITWFENISIWLEVVAFCHHTTIQQQQLWSILAFSIRSKNVVLHFCPTSWRDFTISAFKLRFWWTSSQHVRRRPDRSKIVNHGQSVESIDVTAVSTVPCLAGKIDQGWLQPLVPLSLHIIIGCKQGKSPAQKKHGQILHWGDKELCQVVPDLRDQEEEGHYPICSAWGCTTSRMDPLLYSRVPQRHGMMVRISIQQRITYHW